MAYGEAYAGKENNTPQKMRPGYLAAILILATLAFLSFMLLQFSIDTIKVSGNYIYSDKLIIESSGISVGENLASIQKAKAAGRIMTSLPFVESVHIERELPHTLIIYISEADAAFAISADGETYFLVNADAMITEQLLETEIADYPVVEGLSPIGLEVGKGLADCVPDNTALRDVMTLFLSLNGSGLTGGVRTINIESENDIVVNYDGRYDVYLGSMENLSYKLDYLSAMLDDWDSGNKGAIDLTFELEENARFQPY